jgi:hypothetical protein
LTAGQSSFIRVDELTLLEIASCVMPRHSETIKAPGIIQVDSLFCVVTDVQIKGAMTIYSATLRVISPKRPGQQVWIFGQRNQERRVVYGYIGHRRYEVRA